MEVERETGISSDMRPSPAEPVQRSSLANSEIGSPANNTAGDASIDQAGVTPEDFSTVSNPTFSGLGSLYSVVYHSESPSASPEAYYPRIRYIFSDDDSDTTLDICSAGPSSGHSESTTRSILVDMAISSDGSKYTIASATSLSPEWAVTAATLKPLELAPPGANAGTSRSHTLALEIRGAGAAEAVYDSTIVKGGWNTADQDLTSESHSIHEGPHGTEMYGDLVRKFETQMHLLRAIVHNAEEGRRAMPGLEASHNTEENE